MKFKSEYFETADDLVRAKDDAWDGVKTRRERLDIIRKFTNMQRLMTDEEAEKLGRTEITNFGLSHRDMLQIESQITSMVTTTNGLVEVIVDTDNAEKDYQTSIRISEAINRGAIHFKGKFANLWRKVGGEITIAGGTPVTNNPRYGWLPEIRADMFFPKATPLDAEQVSYAFDPKELSIHDLKHMLAAIGEGQSRYIVRENVEHLIEILEEQVRDNRKDQGSSHGFEVTEAVRDGKSERSTTVSAWDYFEVKYDDKGNQYVSRTLFTDGIDGTATTERGDREDNQRRASARIIDYVEKAYPSATDWLHMVFVDSEIGGVKTLDTCRGIAELIYPSALELEDLINLTLEGDKIRAKPKIQLGDANPDDVARWNIVEDMYAPAGVSEMEFKGNSQGLMTPFSLLRQNAAGLASSSVANSGRGGELRQQALERQENSSQLIGNRLAESYNHMESILETLVWRLLAGDVKPGTEGYHETMWVRAYLDRYDIPYKELAKREHNRFQYIRVRAKRVIGNGDSQQRVETADWLMNNIMNYAPATRPLVVQQATALRTQDPDLAEYLVKVPQAILNAQKITAENEYSTIERRAALGQTIPIAPDDIHQDHIPVHLVDMQAMVAMAQMRPWDKLDVLQFAGLAEHTGEHLQVLMSNPLTNPEAKSFLKDYQNIVASAQSVVQEVEERLGSEQGQLTAREQAEIELKTADLQLKAQALGLKIEDTQRLWASREARNKLSQRSQYAREVGESQRLQLDNKRIETQAVSGQSAQQ
jgi:hypothetical protein